MKWHDKMGLCLFGVCLTFLGTAGIAIADSWIPGAPPDIFWWLWR